MTSVCITTNTLRPGGAERQRVHLANGLASHGYDVECRVLQVSGALEEQLDSAVRLTVLSGRRREYLRPPRADVILTGVTRTEIAHALVTKARGRTSGRRPRWIAASHHAFPFASNHVELPYGPEISQALGLADAVIALTDAHGRYLRKTTRAKRLRVISNGIPPIGFRHKGVAHSRGGTRAAFLGRVTEQKGLEPFLRAWSHDPDRPMSLDIWGDGPLRDALSKRYADLSRVEWRGWADSTYARMAEADVLVVPSLWEAQPMVILEAFSIGLPVAASAVGGVPDLMGGGTLGDLVEPTEQAWAQYLDSLPERSHLLQDKASKAIEHVATNYSIAGMIDEHVSLIDELTAHARVARRR